MNECINEWVGEACRRHSHIPPPTPTPTPKHLHSRFSRRLPASQRLLSFCIINYPLAWLWPCLSPPPSAYWQNVRRGPVWPRWLRKAQRRGVISTPAQPMYSLSPAGEGQKVKRRGKRARIRRIRRRKRGEIWASLCESPLLHRPASPGCEFASLAGMLVDSPMHSSRGRRPTLRPCPVLSSGLINHLTATVAALGHIRSSGSSPPGGFVSRRLLVFCCCPSPAAASAVYFDLGFPLGHPRPCRPRSSFLLLSSSKTLLRFLLLSSSCHRRSHRLSQPSSSLTRGDTA